MGRTGDERAIVEGLDVSVTSNLNGDRADDLREAFDRAPVAWERAAEHEFGNDLKTSQAYFFLPEF